MEQLKADNDDRDRMVVMKNGFLAVNTRSESISRPTISSAASEPNEQIINPKTPTESDEIEIYR